MAPLTFRAFLRNPNSSLQVSPWPPWLAVLAAMVVVAVGQLAPILLISLLVASDGRGAGTTDPEAVIRLFDTKQAALMLASQATMALAVFFLAGRYRSEPLDTLALVAPKPGPSVFLYAFALMSVVLLGLNAITYTISPAGFMQDFRQFQALANGPEPLMVFAAVAIGAPLWEELLFRGFLLPPLAQKLGFWPAALLVSAAWTALHITYSPVGLLEVFAIGTVFAWLLRTTGSLWVPIACHGAYNALLFAALRLFS